MQIAKLAWEVLEDQTLEPDQDMAVHNRVERARVFGGWLVRAYSATMSSVEADAATSGSQGVGRSRRSRSRRRAPRSTQGAEPAWAARRRR